MRRPVLEPQGSTPVGFRLQLPTETGTDRNRCFLVSPECLELLSRSAGCAANVTRSIFYGVLQPQQPSRARRVEHLFLCDRAHGTALDFSGSGSGIGHPTDRN